MFTLFLVVGAFVAGLIVSAARTKIVAYLKRRAEANKIKAAQELVDAYEKAKAVIAANTPVFPPKPQG